MNPPYCIHHLKPIGCEISIRNGDRLDLETALLDKDYSKIVVITDDTLFHLFGEEIKRAFGEKIIIIPEGETGKTLTTAENCWKQILEYECDRSSLIVAVGGGVITDLAGFVAACYMRGIDHIFIPTTLMGMVDASIGGKTAVNFLMNKNLVGAVHQPKAVFIHPHFLKSLPKREFNSGIAEVIKYGVIADEVFFKYLEENMERLLEKDPEVMRHVLIRSAEIKSEIVAQDQKDQTVRAFLNFGHSFAHGIESATHYIKYLHGEAVSIGMCFAADLSYGLGECDESVPTRIRELCMRAKLPVELSDVSTDQVIACMIRDKKNRFGKFNLIVVKKIGKVVKVNDVDVAMIEKTVGR